MTYSQFLHLLNGAEIKVKPQTKENIKMNH